MFSFSAFTIFFKIPRVVNIWRVVFILSFYLYWDSQRFTYLGGYSLEKLERRHLIRAKWLKIQLISLGSAFIKLGQLLSARPDVLPREWVVQLSDLQDQVPAFNFIQAQQLLEQELGFRCAEIIDLEEKPIAAASVAQVHRASLRSGRQVVLKIQRPGLEPLFRLDLYVMKQVAALLQRHPDWGRGRDLIGIAKECRRVLLRELDFRIEAQFAARFRQQFLDDSTIRVPSVVWELSTRRVLCLDYVPGIKINDRTAIIAAGLDPSNIAEVGASSYLQQLVKYGFFHADPHPGNLAVASDGALIYYDFGMMGMVSESLRSRLGEMVRAAALRDASGLVEQLQVAGVISSGIDVGPVRRLVRIMFKEVLTPPFSPNVMEKLSGDLYELVYEQPFHIPVDLIFVMRALSTFEGVGRSLDPSFNLMSIAKPYLLPLMTSSNSSPNDLFNELGRQVGELGSRAVALPRRLDESLERLEQGDLQLQVRMGESDRQFRRLVLAQRANSHSVLLGFLIVSASLLGTSSRPLWTILPLAFAIPIAFGWIKLNIQLRRDKRLDQIPRRQS